MRIGIVNDTVLAREALRRVVLSSGEHEVVWVADDGAQAIAMARQDPPDLILMDLFMPEVNGVEATRRIMGDSPCAILVVTATVSGHLSKVYQAMGYGALDAIDTPTLGPRGEITGGAMLLHKIELIGRLVGKPGKPGRGRGADGRSSSDIAASGIAVEPSPLHPLVVLGASTGGPQALAAILGRLPARLEVGVIIVQHVDASFAPGSGTGWPSRRAGPSRSSRKGIGRRSARSCSRSPTITSSWMRTGGSATLPTPGRRVTGLRLTCSSTAWRGTGPARASRCS